MEYFSSIIPYLPFIEYTKIRQVASKKTKNRFPKTGFEIHF